MVTKTHVTRMLLPCSAATGIAGWTSGWAGGVLAASATLLSVLEEAK